jgi:hypothetical protein
LGLPKNAVGLVVFCHGSGSSRFSSRNRAVAGGVLREGGLATLMLDLLTAEEDAVDRDTSEYRFNIGLLGRRVVDATGWTQQEPVLRALPVALFGASAGQFGNCARGYSSVRGARRAG